MSVNYHAAQSRGVLFENHEKVSEQWRQEFSQYDPARIMNTLHLETDGEYLYLRYFSNLYWLSDCGFAGSFRKSLGFR